MNYQCRLVPVVIIERVLKCLSVEDGQDLKAILESREVKIKEKPNKNAQKPEIVWVLNNTEKK